MTTVLLEEKPNIHVSATTKWLDNYERQSAQLIYKDDLSPIVRTCEIVCIRRSSRGLLNIANENVAMTFVAGEMDGESPIMSVMG